MCVWFLLVLRPGGSCLKKNCHFNPAALLRLRGSTEKVYSELEEMKEEAGHTQSGVTVHDFFQKRSYRRPIAIVLIVNLGSQLSGFNAVSRRGETTLRRPNADE